MKDTEIEVLRERIKEYQQLLSISYYILTNSKDVPTSTYKKYLEKLEEHGITPSDEIGWPSERVKGRC